jgi:tetratricopeptide (TPR) repeat protein
MSSAQPSLESIQAAHAERRYGEARAMCEARLALTQGDADAWMWLGLVAMQERRWSDAAAAFDRALSLRLEPWSLANLGQCYLKLGRLDDAHYCYTTAKEIEPAFTAARVGLAVALHGQRRFDDALAELDEAARIAPEDLQIDVRRGCTLAELGRYDEAQAAFARAAAVSPPYHRLIAFDRATYDAISSGAPAAFSWRDAVTPDASGATGVVLVSADAAYARKYAFACVRSLAAHADPHTIIHVHVYDPVERVVADLEAAAREAGVQRLAITTEVSPFGADAPQRRKSYYACGRLLHLPEWLERYALPIVSLDADIVVEAPPEALLDAAGVDLRLNLRHSIDAPWLDIVANIIVAFPTAAARGYLEAVGRYVWRYLQVEDDPWLLDQSALYCAHRMMQRYGVPPRIDWMHEAEKLGLWHLGHGYDHKLGDERFRKYAGPG